MANEKHMDRNDLMQQLKEWNIMTNTIDHPEVFTVEEMMPYIEHLAGMHTKNLFLKDKKKNLWLVTTKFNQDIKLNDLAKKLGASGGLRFADESILMDKLGVKQGCVTAFALINDTKQEVKFVMDADLMEGNNTLYFHPLSNSATTGISVKDFKTFLDKTNHKPIEIKF